MDRQMTESAVFLSFYAKRADRRSAQRSGAGSFEGEQLRLSQRIMEKDVEEYLEEALNKERRDNRFRADYDPEELPSVEAIRTIAVAFAEGNYIPNIPEKKQISKLGSEKKRIIFLYTPLDRFMLKTIHYCLAREDFGLLPCCLAFRPGFSISRAFRLVITSYREEYTCIRVDLQNFFNSIPADKMIAIIRETFDGEPGLVNALEKMLSGSEVTSDGMLIHEKAKGVMAGMPLAPLLANLYLREFDREALALVPVYARYSDDMIFFCPPEEASPLLIKVHKLLSDKGLTVNIEKTDVYDPGEKWEFLGLSYDRGQIDLSSGAKEKMKGKISRAARKLYRWKIRKNATTERAVRAMIRKFQYKFYGSGREDTELTWSRWYFPLLTRSDSLKEIDQHMQIWLRYLVNGRHSRGDFRKFPYTKMQELGYVPLVTAYFKPERTGRNKAEEVPGTEQHIDIT